MSKEAVLIIRHRTERISALNWMLCPREAVFYLSKECSPLKPLSVSSIIGRAKTLLSRSYLPLKGAA